MVPRQSPFEALLRHLPVPAVVASAETGLIIWVNDRELSLAGAVSPDQLVGHNLMEFLAPEQHGIALRDLEAVTRGESPPPVIYRLQRVDGTTADVMISSVPIKFRDAPAMLSLVGDVTKTQRALEEVSAERDLFRGLVESSPDGVVVVSENGLVLYANLVFAQAVGAPSTDTLVGRAASALVAPDERTRVGKVRRAVLKSGTSVPGESLVLLRADGSLAEHSCSVGPIAWAGEPAVQLVVHTPGSKT